VAYLGDVYILPEYRGCGLSKWLVETIMHHPSLQGLRRWILLTADAHELYRQFGWTEISSPEKWMEIHHKNIYAQ
jgi:GNAT superfamily N-acetyltransferase